MVGMHARAHTLMHLCIQTPAHPHNTRAHTHAATASRWRVADTHGARGEPQPRMGHAVVLLGECGYACLWVCACLFVCVCLCVCMLVCVCVACAAALLPSALL